MSFEEAVLLARQVMVAGCYLCAVTCDLPGAVPGVWRVLFRVQPSDEDTHVLSSAEQWYTWAPLADWRRGGENSDG